MRLLVSWVGSPIVFTLDSVKRPNAAPNLLPRERPQLGQFQEQGPRTHGANARGTLQQVVVFSPQRARPEHRLQIVVQRSDTRIEPGNMGLDVLRQAPVCPRETVLFRGP